MKNLQLTEVNDSVGTGTTGINGKNIEWFDLTALKLLDREAGYHREIISCGELWEELCRTAAIGDWIIAISKFFCSLIERYLLAASPRRTTAAAAGRSGFVRALPSLRR